MWTNRLTSVSMATADRKELHKHFIRGHDPTAPIGDGAPNLLQQVKAGQRGSWEEEGRARGGDNAERGWKRRREKNHFSSLFSLRFIQPVSSTSTQVFCFLRTFTVRLYGDFISCGDQRKLQKQGRGKAFFEATSWFKIKAEKTDFKKACIFFLVFTPLINKKSLRFGVLKESSRPVSNSGLKGVVSLNGCY